MERTLKWLRRAALLLVIGCVVAFVVVPLLPMGKGSMQYARRWKQRLAECKTLADVTNRFACLDVTGRNIGWATDGNRLTLLTFTNDTWIVLRCANSHCNPWGGTLVTHDSTGATRVFFGHVCGSEPLRGLTLPESYSNLMRMDRKEVFLP